MSTEAGRFLRKQIRQMLDAMLEEHNRSVEHYYFLLALHADYDPEARGGPSFADPAELGAYLRQQLKA